MTHHVQVNHFQDGVVTITLRTILRTDRLEIQNLGNGVQLQRDLQGNPIGITIEGVKDLKINDPARYTDIF